MKKNTMMRIASILLIAVLISTSAISGTYAKYVTSDNASDTARVAKWGVEATVTGEAFNTEYAIKDSATDVKGDAITVSVKSSTTDKLVAPGTTGTFTGVALTGTPEVAVNVTHVATITLDGWTLDGGEFYCPVYITIEGVEYSGLNYSSASDFADALKGAIEAANGNYQANTDLSGVAGLNGDYIWTWDFVGKTGTENNQTDEKDTELGNLAAAGTLNTITIAVSTTVTQID